ncbi:hypothetical protein Patl1_04144 [Pistacia atlantica]|uniref:Uncharacterized protein n=1 Tax=Pistacia atlantica TaxID=434234 RepID=A0ACC1BV03_9ROSI|nr:hypothetical protein Patl1_04144 [Pistacia atlantica]
MCFSYLELAILPCWRFLHDQHVDTLQRLVLMTRGLGDPLASAYCRLYLAHCARKLSSYDTGHLITSVNDIKILLMWNSSTKESTLGKSTDNKRLLVSLMEPTIEYLMKCIFKDASQRQVGSALVELGLGRNQVELFGSNPYVSIILHHLLKELPTEIVSSNAVEILHLIECSNDDSFDQCLNYRLLGFRLSESKPTIGIIHAVVDRIIQVVTVYDKLDDYLKIVDAYVDIILQDRMFIWFISICLLRSIFSESNDWQDNHLNTILEGISERACCKEIVEDEVVGLQSILMKFLSHFRNLEDVLALGHFLEILDVMYGNSQNFIYMQILSMATRMRVRGELQLLLFRQQQPRNGNIHDPTTVQLLFEICQSLHDGMDFANMKDDDHQQPARLISRFVQMVDYGVEMEGHLTFLVECRGAFGGINELKVAMLAGLVSHADGLIDSAVSCLKSVDLINGFQAQADVDEIVISIRKLCSLLVMVPGNPELGLTSTLKNILPLVNSQSWMTSRMKIRIFSAIVSLSATLSQNKLPYHTDLEIPGNDLLFYGDSSYVEELASFSEDVLKNLVDAIEQEPSTAARGNMALEACNCIVSSFKVRSKPDIALMIVLLNENGMGSDQTLVRSHLPMKQTFKDDDFILLSRASIINEDIRPICSKLIETAKLHLNSSNKYLQSTIKFLDQQSPTSGVAA